MLAIQNQQLQAQLQQANNPLLQPAVINAQARLQEAQNKDAVNIAKAQEDARQFNIKTAQEQQQFAAQLAEEQRQHNDDIAVDIAKLNKG